MQETKKMAAERALEFITPGMIVGLGDGQTMRMMADLIAADPDRFYNIMLTSPSPATLAHFASLSLPGSELRELSSLDIYFDGCDEFDQNLHALKSGAGIHTLEKVAAAMAKTFILVGDRGKFSQRFSGRFPLLIEVLPIAIKSVTNSLHHLFPTGKFRLRVDADGSESLSTQNNLLLEAWFEEWPDIASMNDEIKMLPGVLNHSLFFGMATKAIISDGIQTNIYTRSG